LAFLVSLYGGKINAWGGNMWRWTDDGVGASCTGAFVELVIRGAVIEVVASTRGDDNDVDITEQKIFSVD
jgi:hypothetical protein